MTGTVQDMIEDILEREGGYVNHPSDRGGPTKYGVTLKTLSAVLGRPATIEDVRVLGYDQAATIYRDLFYRQPQIHRLPGAIQPQIFDMAVNHGPHRAIVYLQRFLRECREPVKTDGILGPKTAGAAERVLQRIGSVAMNNGIAELRKRLYRQIVQHDPSQNVFINGWLARADEFITAETAVETA